MGEPAAERVGHEVIVAHARHVRLIGESRKKDDRLDAQTLARLARIDSEIAVSGEASQCQSAGGPERDPGTSGTGASPNGAGEHGAWTGEVLRGAAARVQRTEHESGESGVRNCKARWSRCWRGSRR